jgi:BirA family biotin operon repressor/biotin-[acetyl-CoA-carboxylase] ligase
MKDLVGKYSVEELQHLFPPFFAITADQQEQGRGRQEKKWESETGKNLLISLLLYPRIGPSLQFDICRYVSVAVAGLISELCPASVVRIKWPNDVYIGNKKTAGILIEHFIQGENINYSIAGIGINLNQTVFSLSLPNPTSVLSETGKEQDPMLCMQNMINKMKDIEKQSPDKWRIAYDEYLYQKGVFARFIIPKVSADPLLLKITGVDQTGLLQLTDTNDRLFSCAFNEIIYCLNR